MYSKRAESNSVQYKSRILTEISAGHMGLKLKQRPFPSKRAEVIDDDDNLLAVNSYKHHIQCSSPTLFLIKKYRDQPLS